MQKPESIGRGHDDQLRPTWLRRTSAEPLWHHQSMTSTSLRPSRGMRLESMVKRSVVMRADDARSTGPTHFHCQCCLGEAALEGRIREIPTPTSIVRHSRIHSINSTPSADNGHASRHHEHSFSSPSHVCRAVSYFKTRAEMPTWQAQRAR